MAVQFRPRRSSPGYHCFTSPSTPTRHGARMRPVSLVLVLTLLAAPACLTEESPADPDLATITYAAELGVDIAASTRVSGGTYYRDLTPGDGEVIATGQVLNVRYVGWLSNGVKFDERTLGMEPYQFTLGTTGLIRGWNAGVPGMRVGGLRQLIIPPSQGYGQGGSFGVPPNSVLVFNVHVLSVE